MTAGIMYVKQILVTNSGKNLNEAYIWKIMSDISDTLHILHTEYFK